MSSASQRRSSTLFETDDASEDDDPDKTETTGIRKRYFRLLKRKTNKNTSDMLTVYSMASKVEQYFTRKRCPRPVKTSEEKSVFSKENSCHFAGH